jgi:hypothetical protein
MTTLLEVLAALVPSIGVGLLFYLAIRSLMNADRNERAALARIDAELEKENEQGSSAASA